MMACNPGVVRALVGAAVLVACGTNPTKPSSPSGVAGQPTAGQGGSADDAPPSFSKSERSVLAELSPTELPGPIADVSNKYADDAAAAELGRRLFFDPALSGKLLDADNDGGPNSLGKRGESGKVACAGCHLPDADFADTRSTFQEISLGTGWTHRRTPALLDVGQARIVMWAGRHSTLWSQPFGPLENPLEMNSSRLFVAQQVAQRYADAYEAIFGKSSLADLATAKRFPVLTSDTTGCKLTKQLDRPRALPPDPLYECHGTPGDGAEYDGLSEADQKLVTQVVVNAGKALAAFERTLSCGKSRFDAWVAGDNKALTPSEQRGAQLFIGKAKCVSCHSGPFFSDQQFHNTGMKEAVTKEGIFNGPDSGAGVDLPLAKQDPVGILGPFSDGDDGRLPETIGDEYTGAFRTPTLRCVGRRPSYMHSGTMHTLDAVVAFFARGGDEDGFLGKKEVEALSLSNDEMIDLIAFLKTLDGPGTPVKPTL